MFASLTNGIPACDLTPGSGFEFLKFPTWYKYLQGELTAGKCSPVIDLNSPGDVGRIVLAVVEILLRVGGLVALGFVIYGGFRYILSQGAAGPGDVPRTVSARRTIINALIGLVIAMSATFIVQLIAQNVSSK